MKITMCGGVYDDLGTHVDYFFFGFVDANANAFNGEEDRV